MRLKPKTSLAASLAALALAGGAVAAETLDPNPANDPELISKRLDPVRYDGGGNCVRDEPRGSKALIHWMKANTSRRTAYGTIRCDGGVHGTGRALDWMLDARDPKQKRLAMRVINTWLADDARGRPHALARRMGIQLIIYNCRWWQAGDSGWQPYGACSGSKAGTDPTQGHIDHIHVELTKPAAALRTSYWAWVRGGGEPSAVGGPADDDSGGISPGP